MGPDIHLSVVMPIKDGDGHLAANLAQLASYCRARPYPTEVVLVDDGSRAAPAETLARVAREQGLVVLRNDVTRGKGHAVARGLAAARGRFRVFTDADLAYPVDQIGAIVAALETGADVAVACRVLPESRYVMSPAFFHYLYTRHVISRLFNAFTRHVLLPGILDSQAGLKGLTAAAVARIVPQLTVPGFAFDVELLHIAARAGLRVQQVPVTFRYDSEPTTVRFLADSWQMSRDVFQIRRNGTRGRYT